MQSAQSLSARSSAFLAVARQELQLGDLEALPRVTEHPPVEAERVVIDDPSCPTAPELAALARGFKSRFGLVAFECNRTHVAEGHPLILIGAHLSQLIPTKWPVSSSPADRGHITEIRDVGVAGQSSRSLTNEAMAAHQDGWLSLRDEDRGALAVTGLWADGAPVESAATFSQNIVLLALDLWRRDEVAFASLFADDSIKIVKRADKVVALSPVLFLKFGVLQSFYRGHNDEFDVVPGGNDPANARAIEFLNAHSAFGSNGTVFTHLDRRGRGLLLNNRHCIHGRTAFRDGATSDQKRVIAAKWWASHDEHRDLIWE
jgi:hypothetical protein